MERKITPPVILICGPAGHGKTIAREILARVMQLRGGSCSDVVYSYLSLIRSTTAKALKEQDKEELRPVLIKIGNWLCGDIGSLRDQTDLGFVEGADVPKDEDVYRVPSSLIRTLYHNGCNVIDGIRRKLELQHAVEHFDWNGVRTLSIFVSRPGGPVVVDNTEDLASLCDERVVNDGSVEDLEKKLIEVLVRRFPA